jgi:hypothetical protein
MSLFRRIHDGIAIHGSVLAGNRSMIFNRQDMPWLIFGFISFSVNRAQRIRRPACQRRRPQGPATLPASSQDKARDRPV